MALLAGAPLAAVGAGHAACSAGSRIAHAQQATWRQVPAVLAATAPAARFRQYQVTVPARWTAPDGTRHAGAVLALPGTRAGRAVMVWVDAADRPGDKRPCRSQARTGMLPCMNMSADSPSAANGTTELTERVRQLEGQMAALTEALEVLTRGLESSPMAEPPNRHIEEAARRAHELLLLAKTATPGGGPAEGGTST
jgi:hypothetical protein